MNVVLHVSPTVGDVQHEHPVAGAGGGGPRAGGPLHDRRGSAARHPGPAPALPRPHRGQRAATRPAAVRSDQTSRYKTSSSLVTYIIITRRFIERLTDVLELKEPVTVVLDDPAGNSYVQSLADDPLTPDDGEPAGPSPYLAAPPGDPLSFTINIISGLKVERYVRTFEQNEELGLNDMKTENYEGC